MTVQADVAAGQVPVAVVDLGTSVGARVVVRGAGRTCWIVTVVGGGPAVWPRACLLAWTMPELSNTEPLRATTKAARSVPTSVAMSADQRGW